MEFPFGGSDYSHLNHTSPLMGQMTEGLLYCDVQDSSKDQVIYVAVMYAIEVYCDHRNKEPCMLELHSRWRCVVNSNIWYIIPSKSHLRNY